jgi:hypothetical protein
LCTLGGEARDKEIIARKERPRQAMDYKNRQYIDKNEET